MKRIENNLEEEFKSLAKEFALKCLPGFNSRKPKKIIIHIKNILRAYRNKDIDILKRLVGTILIWRYAMMPALPKKVKSQMAQQIVRSFNFILLEVKGIDSIKMIQYLMTETTPKRSVFHPGNPLRVLLEMKKIEINLLEGKLSKDDSENSVKEWKNLQKELNLIYRIRIPIPEI